MSTYDVVWHPCPCLFQHSSLIPVYTSNIMEIHDEIISHQPLFMVRILCWPSMLAASSCQDTWSAWGGQWNSINSVRMLVRRSTPTSESLQGIKSYGCVWKCCVPLCTQWFCWSLSLWKMAISLGVYPIFRHTHIKSIEISGAQCCSRQNFLVCKQCKPASQKWVPLRQKCMLSQQT